jgi:Cysteine-rich secretory protein family
MLALINQDRATEHLAPVELDEGPPTTAGQAHAEDMAKNGYLGHWGTDGSVPEQRHSEAGGSDMVSENALCFTDLAARKLDGHPLVDAVQIAKAESMFFNEVPPNDGHRKNILKPFHTKVGIGVAQPLNTEAEVAVPCFSQEFIDSYGTYDAVPKQIRVGSKLHVAGTIRAPAIAGGVGLARLDSPRPVAAAVLNTRRTYEAPKPYQIYWPAGFDTPIPLTLDGNHFAIDIPVSDGKKPGMYELTIWAKLPGSKQYTTIGVRTIRVE